jgi:hypothetical protein
MQTIKLAEKATQAILANLTAEEEAQFTRFNYVAFQDSVYRAQRCHVAPPMWLCTSEEARKRQRQHVMQRLEPIGATKEGVDKLLESHVTDDMLQQWRLFEADMKRQRETNPRAFFVPIKEGEPLQVTVRAPEGSAEPFETVTLDRQEMVDRLEWNHGGGGFGICREANSMMWAMERPKEPHGADDLKSIVAVSAPADEYSDEELKKLVEFSERQTFEYDQRFRGRLGANVILIGKKFEETRWYRKRLSWESGPMYSDSLDEAIAVFEK